MRHSDDNPIDVQVLHWRDAVGGLNLWAFWGVYRLGRPR